MPGKFNSDLDEMIYERTLDGTCETIDNGGGVSVDHYSLYWLDENDRERLPAMSGLEDGAVTAAAAIVHENDQGFVDVDYFNTTAEANSAWASIPDAPEGGSDQL